MKRVEEFEAQGKKFIYIDYSNIDSNAIFEEATAEAKKVILKYPKKSVFTISNGSKALFDTKTRSLVSEVVEVGSPNVIHWVVIGVDGIRRLMVKTVMRVTGHSNFTFLSTKEEALEWILNKYGAEKDL